MVVLWTGFERPCARFVAKTIVVLVPAVIPVQLPCGHTTYQSDDIMSDLAEWSSFYVILGSASGALIGLQFVVMSLIANRPRLRVAEAGAAFGTPTIVHFGVVLLLSAVASIPWHEIGGVPIAWGSVGVGGIAYSIVVARRMRAQNVYQPVFEDWLFHVLLPFAAYSMLVGSAYVASSLERPALFTVSAATLLFLFVGIHNAWDAVTYHIFTSKGTTKPEEPPDPGNSN